MKNLIIITFILLLSFTSNIHSEKIHLQNTNKILVELSNSLDLLQKEVSLKQKLLKNSKLENEKTQITNDLTQLFRQLQKTSSKFEEIATGIDTYNIKNPHPQKILLSEELQILIRPLITVAKSVTQDMREKAILLSEIDEYRHLLPKAQLAVINLQKQHSANKVSKKVDQRIIKLISYWKKQSSLIESQFKSSKHELYNLEKSKAPLFISIQSKVKSFFRQRGFYLFEALFVSILILIFTKLLYTVIIKAFPQFSNSPRSFYIRVIELSFRIISIVLAILGPMLIFYIEEDWILFSIGLLVFFGAFWVFRNTIPGLWQQALLLLNIGTVRENERVFYKGLPWLVKEINLYSKLENPMNGLKLRLPIHELLTLISKSSSKYEPWFPCKLYDWVLLSNNTYGKVIGISLEFIDLIIEGGSKYTLTLDNFLGLNPTNFSKNFVIKSILGVSYKHQSICHKTLLKQLEVFIQNKLKTNDYTKNVLHLSIEVELLNESSIDIAIIINFDGQAAPSYKKLSRLTQMWAMEACTNNNWEIPFPQLSIHSN
ncbi:MAG: hypothetical protein COB02_10450 [Candidatus Cloacimonadota bacterium]|nr:MAG: hypothetical protein COB02_10450 [Candidatus Cloacimonadota bacterium]